MIPKDPFEDFRRKKEADKIARIVEAKTVKRPLRDVSKVETRKFPAKAKEAQAKAAAEPAAPPKERKTSVKKAGFYDKAGENFEKTKKETRAVKPPEKRSKGKESTLYGGFHISSYFKNTKKRKK
jgi:hypothetical protein